MPRTLPVLAIAACLAAAGSQPAPAWAQTQPAETARAAVSPAPPAPLPARPVQGATRVPLLTRLGHMFTGAVIGGWLGYFASQLAVSDWDAGSAGDSGRAAWAGGGAVLGLVIGRVVSGSGAPGPSVGPMAAAGSRPIERAEIERSGAVNAYELVRSLRKDWLIPRGVNSWRESARGSADFDAPLIVTAGADHVLVYLDNAKLGGTQTLAEIGLEAIGRLEFVDAAQATFRWGTGHAHGVILLTTRGFEADR
jgi:hypothetical protein